MRVVKVISKVIITWYNQLARALLSGPLGLSMGFFFPHHNDFFSDYVIKAMMQ